MTLENRLYRLSENKRALLAQMVKAEAAGEPIAVVGMGCRFPGGADSPAAYWRLLREGRDVIKEIPRDRWDLDEVYDPNPDAPGKIYTRWGGFLDDIDRFDATLFGISQADAEGMDPQQRIVLETAWEALESAGYPPMGLMGSQTGVFLGSFQTTYAELRAREGDLSTADESSLGGVVRCMAAGRLSYLFGFQGPSIPVDTACSSALVATDMACRALRAGECDMALACAVNVLLSLEWLVAFCRVRALSPDGRCRAFDAAANGLVESEGCGVLVLKRLSDAQAAGDPVLAVIRGSAVNHNGRGASLFAPHGKSQTAVIRKALAAAGVKPADIGLLEAHGAGTLLGDPIEVEAAAAVLAEGRRPDQRAWLTSVKTNIGNTEAASGMASMIKAILSLQHEAIPPLLHFKAPNPYISFERTPFAIPTRLQPWPRSDRPRLAGVSSFGLSGTNAHLVLEEAPAPPRASRQARPRNLLCLSAQTDQGLRDLAERYRAHLARPEAGRATDLPDLAFTANAGRTHQRERLAVTAGSGAELSERLSAFLSGEAAAFARASVRPEGRPRVAVFFSGEDAPYPGMGRRLYELEPIFRRTVDACAEALRGSLEVPLLDALSGGAGVDGLAPRADVAQPLLYALECALFDLWKSWGVAPAAVMGHGLGELAAAYAVSALSLADGAKLAAWRGRLMRAAHAGVDPLLGELEQAAEKVRLAAPSIRLVSAATGAVVPSLDARQLLGRLREPLRSCEVGRAALARGGQLLLEIGPGAAPAEPAAAPAEPDLAPVASLRGGGDEWEALLAAAGELYARGIDLDFRGMDKPFQPRVAPAPTYPFQRQRYWMRTRSGGAAPAPAAGDGGHALLYRTMRTARGELYLEGELTGEQELPFLEHRFSGAPLLPTASAFDLMLSAASAAAGAGAWALSNVSLHAAVPLGNGVRLQVWLGAESGGARPIELHACAAAEPAESARWWKAASGELRRTRPAGTAPAPEVGARAQVLDAGTCYRALHESGLDFGPSFHCLERMRIDGQRAVAEVRGASAAPGWGLPPAMLEACFQALCVLQRQLLSGGPDAGRAYLPVSAEQVTMVPGAPARLRCEVSWRQGPAGPEAVGDLRALDDAGRVVIEVKGLKVQRTATAARRSPASFLYGLKWLTPQAAAAPARASLQGTWVVLADAGDVAAAVQGRVRAAGARAVLVTRGGEPGARRLQPDHFEISGLEALSNVLQTLARDGAPARGLVHLWPLDEPAAPEGAEKLVADLVALVQAVEVAGLAAPPRLYLATRGAQPAGGTAGDGAVAQAALWGAAGVLALEHPNLWGGCVDVGPTERGEQAAVAVEAALASTSEDLHASRRGERYVPRLAKLAVDTPAAPLRPDGVYLVNGGLGPLGLQVARWLVERGARHLVLLDWADRAEAAEPLAALRAAGADVQVVQADASREDALAAALAPALRGQRPLRGVVHAAGMPDGTPILYQTAEHVSAVVRPMVRGAWSLHLLTAGQPLDFFVLFSSASGVMGLRGQVAGAAASAALDALAHHRRAAGLPGLSVDWGPWADEEAAKWPPGWGMAALDAESCFEALGALIARGPAQAVALQVDWAAFGEHADRGQAPLYRSVAPAAHKPEELTGAAALRERLQGLPRRERLRALQREVQGVIARSLNMPELVALPPTRPLVDAGVDSLRAVAARNALAQYFSRDYPSKLLFDYATVEALSQHLAKEEPVLQGLDLYEEVKPAEAPPPPPVLEDSPEGLLARLARMSDEEAESLAASLASNTGR